jgi:hypothetical protein
MGSRRRPHPHGAGEFEPNPGLRDGAPDHSKVIVWAQMIASILSLVHGAGLHQVRVLLEDQHAPNGLQSLYTVRPGRLWNDTLD